MKLVAIIQARMGSSRLPGKVLMDLGGETVLARVVHRLQGCRGVSKLVVATTTLSADDAIVTECGRLEIACFRGSENDVLDRYYGAAQAHDAEAIVRITADCPAIDSALVDETIAALTNEKADYASNVLTRTYPRGLDAEVFTSGALERAWKEAREPYLREHVTPYFYEHPEIFRISSVTNSSVTGSADYSRYRWTVDTPEDMKLLRTIYSRFNNRDDFEWKDVIRVMEREPELAEINGQILQKSVRES